MGKEKEARKLKLNRKWLCAIALAVIIVSTTLTYFCVYSPRDQQFLKAVIIDQAAVLYFNGELISAVESILVCSNYTVDYIDWGRVTVEFYKNLPKQGYSLVIMRAHSRPMAICTGELYDKTEHVPEQLTGEVVQTFVGSGTYFGITASFVRNMRGRFHNTIILNMGCNALSETAIAQAFIEKGAKAYIGWKQSVLASHTDQATIHLLIHLIMERKTISQAVTETMTQMGSYPVLAYYPPEAGEMKVIASSGLASTFFLFGTTVSFMVGISNGYLVNYWCDDCKNTIINGSGEDPIFEPIGITWLTNNWCEDSQEEINKGKWLYAQRDYAGPPWEGDC